MEQTTIYRGLVARGNYLSLDRSDIGFAVKELCRNMSSPSEGDWMALKRLGRYLHGRERAVVKFPYQEMSRKLEVWVDTVYAGCKRTRKSTSGGAVLLGGHLIKSWSITQAVIALSSGEAEYYGIVKGASTGLGISSILRDLGHQTRVVIHTDASAAKSLASRKGLGRARHIEVNQLWIQERISEGVLEVRKAQGAENIADAITKHVEAEGIQSHSRA